MPADDAADTSNNQGAAVVTIGPTLAAMGVEGWWAKATQSDGFRDKYWPACRQARIDAGLRYGGPYHWLQPNHDVGAQFANFVGYVGDLLPGECIQLDIEDPGGLPDALVFDFIDRCEARWPERVIVYTGRWYMPYNPTGKHVESYLIDRLIARYGADLKWWLPWYDSRTLPANLPVQPVMWQWAGGNPNSPVPGLNVPPVGQIDTNQIIDRDRLERLCGYVKKPDPPIEPTEIIEEADVGQFRIIYPEGVKYEIIAGRRRDVTDDELFYALGGVFQRPDGTFADGFGKPVATPDSRKPIAFVGDRDRILALPIYEPTSTGPKGDPGPAPTGVEFKYDG